MGGLFLFQFNLSSQGIHGGTPVDISEAPFTVSIEQNGVHACGGTIIHCRWIVTAAHCVQAITSPSSITIHAGATDQTDNSVGQRIVADKIIIHNPYLQPCSVEDVQGFNDIALIRLSEPLEFNNNVAPIEIATSSSKSLSGSSVSIYGWGDNGSGVQATLHKAVLPIISNDEAGQMLLDGNSSCVHKDFDPKIHNSFVSLYAEGIAAGNSDSGGPAILNSSNTLIGASSFGGEPEEDFPTVYADVGYHSNWIEATIMADEISEDGCCGEEGMIIENETVTWDDVKKIFKGNITVKAGGTLEINNSRIAFEEGYGIKVEAGGKLEANVTTFTRCPFGTDWAGIKVQGSRNGAPPGIINMIDVVTIEYARTGISTAFGGAPWNGNIQCNWTFFIRNRRAVEFMSDRGNISTFNNCTFQGELSNNNDVGVTMWDTHGVEFNQCIFSNFAYSGLYTIDASFSVLNQCKFFSSTAGIYATSTTGISNNITEIRDNTSFSDNFYGIYTGSMRNFDVISCDFKCNTFGAVALGTSDIFYNKNNFNNHIFSISLNSTAGQENRLWCNTYNNSGVGLNVFGNNSSLNFDYEEFNTQTNVQLDGRPFNPGRLPITMERELSDGPLSNKFSSTIAEIASDPNNGHTLLFNYRHPEKDLYPEYIAECDNAPPVGSGCSALNNYSNFTFQGSPNPCVTGRPNPITNCDNPDCLSTIRLSFNNLQSAIDNGNNSNEILKSLEATTTKREIATYNFINNYLDLNDYETIETVLTNESSDNSDLMKLIEVQIYTQQYDLAQNLLADFQPHNPNELDFIALHSIHLEYLTNPDFQLSVTDRSTLQSIIDNKGTMAGYASGVQSKVDGMNYMPSEEEGVQKPECSQEGEGGGNEGGIGRQSKNWNNSSNAIFDKIELAPNPSTGEVLLSLPDSFNGSDLMIINLYGQEVQKIEKVQSGQKINLNPSKSGIYIFTISDNSGKVITERLLIQK